MLDILGKRYLFFGISIVVILTGMVMLDHWWRFTISQLISPVEVCWN